jgi:hypothetical protein
MGDSSLSQLDLPVVFCSTLVEPVFRAVAELYYHFDWHLGRAVSGDDASFDVATLARFEMQRLPRPLRAA